MTRFEVGDLVQLVAARGLHPDHIGRYGEVVGIREPIHCRVHAMYGLEYAQGIVGLMCGCAMKRAKNNRTIVKWADCIWNPKSKA